MKKKRTRLFSVTAKDCDWQEFKGSGNGGQKKQKTSSGIRCVHKPSGAVGQASDTRSQPQNRRTAFERMVNSKEFQAWLQLETDCHTGKVKLEVSDGSSGWIERPVFSKLDG